MELRRLLAAPVLDPPLALIDRDDYIVDEVGAELTPGRFEWEYTGQRLAYRFDQPVDVQRQHLILTRLNDGVQLPPSAAAAGVSGFNTMETFTFPDENAPVPNTLPDGNYEAVLRAGANGPANQAGERLASENVTDFFVFLGDINHDRAIDGADYGIIDNTIQMGLRGEFQGDINYDGVIDAGDYGIIDNQVQFNTNLPAPPMAANSLVAYASLGRGRIDLNWTAPADMTGIDGFHISRSTDGGATYTQHATVAATERHWLETGLTDGTKYYYRVRPFSNSAGDGPTTNEAWAVTGLPGPGELIATAVGPTVVNLNWTDNTDAETAYQIWQSTNGGAFVLVDTLPTNEEQGPMVYQRTGLSPTTSYRFRVRAISADQISIFTLSASATTPALSYDIPIENGSFEQPALTDGQSQSPVPGWTVMDENPNDPLRVLNPPADGSVYPVATARDGENVLLMPFDGGPEPVMTRIRQPLDATFQPITTYTLEFWAAPPDTFEPGGLFAGEQLMAGGVAREEHEIVDGFVRVTATVDSADFPQYVGQPLSVELWGEGDTAYDAVRLTAVPNSTPQSPLGGTARPAPGIIEFEHFDEGGEGVAYHDNTIGNRGGVFRLDEDTDVDVARDEVGGYSVAWTGAGEWLEYTIDVAAGGGTYDLTSYVGSLDTGGTFHWEVDGVSVGTSIQVPNTYRRYWYRPLTVSGVQLSGGTHVLRLCLDTEGPNGVVGNFNYFALTDPNAAVAAPANLTATAHFPTRIDLTWTRASGSGIETGYAIEKSSDGGTNWTPIDNIRAGATTFAETGLSASTPYLFRVAALNGTGAPSAWSQAGATTPAVAQWPYRVNFQINESPAVPGYKDDHGVIFGDRGDGYFYGWNFSHEQNDRDRATGIDRKLDTLIHFAQGGEWSINVPDGTYDVKVSVGDASFPSTYTLNVNGVNYWNAGPLVAGVFEDDTKTINVTGGKIYVDQGSAPDKATRINYIEISPAGNPPPPGTPIVTVEAKKANGDAASEAFESGQVPAYFTISRSGDTTSTLLVYYTLAGSAGNGDYTTDLPATGRYEFAAGENAHTFVLTPVDDDGAEPAETVSLSLLGNSAYTLGTPSSTLATIFDNDGPFEGITFTSPTTEQIDFAWPQETDSDVHQYAIYRDTNPNFTPSGSTLLNIADTNAYSDFEVEPDTTYHYIVTAIHDDGLETRVGTSPAPLSAKARANDDQLPQTPNNFLVTQINDLEIQLTWTPGGTNQTKFVIQRSLDNITFTTVKIVSADANAWTDRNLDIDRRYYYRMWAKNKKGISSFTFDSTLMVSRGYQSMVVIVGGHFQKMADLDLHAGDPDLDSGFGVGGIAKRLRRQDYNVFLFSEFHDEDVDENGRGIALTEIEREINDRGIRYVTFIGYSHGGSGVYYLSERLLEDIPLGRPYTVPFVTYIDAIQRFAWDDFIPAPPQTAFPAKMHVGYNVREPHGTLLIKGTAIDAMEDELVHTTDSGKWINHSNLPQQRSVWGKVVQRVNTYMPEK